MYLSIFRNISGDYRQNARDFGIGIIGNSTGIFGQALFGGVGVPLASPFLATIQPGAADATESGMIGDGVVGAQRGVTSSFQIVSRDRQGLTLVHFSAQPKPFWSGLRFVSSL